MVKLKSQPRNKIDAKKRNQGFCCWVIAKFRTLVTFQFEDLPPGFVRPLRKTGFALTANFFPPPGRIIFDQANLFFGLLSLHYRWTEVEPTRKKTGLKV